MEFWAPAPVKADGEAVAEALAVPFAVAETERVVWTAVV